MLIADTDHSGADLGQTADEQRQVGRVVGRQEDDVHQAHSTRITDTISLSAASISSLSSPRTITYPSPS